MQTSWIFRDRVTFAITSSLDVDTGVVAEHQPGRPGHSARTHDLDLPADQRVLHVGDVDDPAVLEDDGVLDLGVEDLAPGGHRGVRPDVAVHDTGAPADDGRAPDGAALDLRAL